MDPSGSGWSNDDQAPALCSQTSGLQELCVLAIIENFDALCFAFKTGNSKVPKKNWEFLERRYSEKIFEELKISGKLKSHHFDLLINPHTKKLDLEGISNRLLPDLVMRLKERGTNILALKACTQGMNDGMCNSLMSALPKVEEIDYLDEEFSDVETKSLRKKIFRFRKMSLRKRCAHIPQTCRAIGRNCRFLKRLMFQYYDILNAKRYTEGIAFIIKNCPCLEMLQYRDTIGALYTLHKTDLSSSKSSRNSCVKTGVKYLLKNLTSGNRSYKLRDALSVCVDTCPHVSRLHIDYLENDEELEMISHFDHLEHIQFDSMDVITASCLGTFLNLKGNKFTTLELPYKSGLPIETLIKCCPKLQSLKLSYVQVSEFNGASDQSYKDSLPDLKTLELSFTDFDDQSTAASLKHILLAARNLQNLSLNDSSGLTSEFFGSLELRNIRVLNASSSDITVDSLIELLLHGTLQRLRIEFCENLSHDDYFTLTRCVAENNKNVEIMYEPVRTVPWGTFRSCCMAYIP